MGQGRQWMRGFVATMATVALGVGIAPVAAHAATTAQIVVTPSTGLASGQKLHVTGSGFKAKQQVVGVECLRGTKTPTDCDLENIVFVTADTGGGFTTTFGAHRTLFTRSGLVDCAPAACEMLFALATDFKAQATTALAFDPTKPLPKTMLSVKPATGLLDQQSVSVSGVGFVAGDDIAVIECVVAPFSCGPGTDVTARPDGHFSTAFAVHRILANAKGARLDCAKKAGTCELLAIDGLDADYHATAPLAFDASVPPPPQPTLSVDPDTKLPFYARVSVTGAHFSPNDEVLLLECASKTSPACEFVDFPSIPASGVLTSKPMLLREIPDPVHPTRPPIDCAAPTAHCLVIAQSEDGTSVSVPVSFDPHAPIPPAPTATVAPAAPYRNNQIVQVKGSNFAPKASFSVSECATQADEEDCLGETAGGPQITSATGSLSTQFQLQRRMETFDGFVDCNAKGVQCTLEVSSEGGALVVVPLKFKAKAGNDDAAPTASVATRRGSSWAAPARSSCLSSRYARILLPSSISRVASACPA